MGFDHLEVVAVSDPAGAERDLSRVLAAPLPEVRYAFEPLHVHSLRAGTIKDVET
jgi:hypothetical protein